MKRLQIYAPGLLLLLALIIMWIPWLGETLFYSKGEPREALVAVSMLQQGDWVLPATCGTDIPYKPPFLAWIVAIFASVLNGGMVNEFISRLPSALAAIGLVMGTYAWARKARGERFALIMSIVLATSVEFYRAATACRVDMVLTACMVGAMYLIFDLFDKKKINWLRYVAIVLLLSGAVLTKGPVGALLPCLAMGIYFLLRGERFFPTLGRLTLLCLVSFLLPALWYYAAWLRGGNDFLSLVWEENIQRLAGTMPYESHVKPFWYNFVTIIVGLLPWTLLCIFALVKAGKFRIPHLSKMRPAALLSLTAAIVIVGFYCIPASKRSVYLLPAYPFMAYGIAALAESLTRTRINKAYTYVIAVIAVAAPVALLVNCIVPLTRYEFDIVGWWVYPLLLLPIVTTAIVLRRCDIRKISGACIITLSILTTYGGAIMPGTMNQLSDKPDAARLSEIAGDRSIYIVGDSKHFANIYAVNYYLNDRVRRINNASEADTCAVGTVLVFVNEPDTVGLPASYTLRQLKPRLSDTRREAFYAVKVK